MGAGEEGEVERAHGGRRGREGTWGQERKERDFFILNFTRN